MSGKQFVIERTYDAPLARVWQAISDKEQMKEWYFDIPDFAPVAGTAFHFYAEDDDCAGYLHLGKVIEAIPNRLLRYSWRYDGIAGDSVVTFELFEDGSKTGLRLTHDGLNSFPALPAFAYKSFAAGWTQILGLALPDFIETVTIKEEILISSDAFSIWKTITDSELTKLWAKAFYEGTTVTSGWLAGDELTWLMPDGTVAARGIIRTAHPGLLLHVDFYDDINTEHPGITGAYSEIFQIEKHVDNCTLRISSGPVTRKQSQAHAPMWAAAIEYIKSITEDKNS